MMKQYNSFKSKYPGAILLFRVGDFYETFGQDAVLASQILGITLTKRNNGSASETELAGFPYHALDNYLSRLVKSGQRVAICDQIEDPRFAKKLVKRGVTELVSPGVSYNDQVLETKSNNYLASLTHDGPTWGISFLDISTGEFLVYEGNQENIEKLIASFNPAEVLCSKAERGLFLDILGDKHNPYFLEEWFFQYEFAYELLIKHFATQSLKGFGVEKMAQGLAAAGAILHYLEQSMHQHLKHITSLSRIEQGHYVWLDQFTIRNLELVYPQQSGGVSLMEILDHTHSPMGSRLLRKWTMLPLKNKEKILERQSVVSSLLENPGLCEEIQEVLQQVGDLERLISKVASRRVRPRELLQIKKSLQHIKDLKEKLLQVDIPFLQKYAHRLDPCPFLMDTLEKSLLENPKALINEGGLIKGGVSESLDELRDIVDNSKAYLEKTRQHAVEETGISSLKIGFNKVFGYYLEVSNTHKNKVPTSWVRKQTLTSAERYITEELKEYEDKILHAEEKIVAEELQLYQQLVEDASDFIAPIQQDARVLGGLDCLCSFATLALKYDYCCPQLGEDFVIDIQEGRHPVIERQLPADQPFIPNSLYLDRDDQQIMVITGPNMAGKSALLRQVALICIMAQMGSFVPAKRAKIGIVDKIFTRVGASDNLARGESTFMVEMMETASIMNNLSDRSLVLMDEIGRGTSTYDGISIAWSILEYLHEHPRSRPKTLFATHYHELNELANQFSRIHNFHVSVKEINKRIVFLRKLSPGGSEHSFGIHVAKMAGIPPQVVERAQEIMHYFESERLKSSSKSDPDLKEKLKDVPPNSYQLNIFEAQDPALERIKNLLESLDVNMLSPIEALLKLNELKSLLQK